MDDHGVEPVLFLGLPLGWASPEGGAYGLYVADDVGGSGCP